VSEGERSEPERAGGGVERHEVPSRVTSRSQAAFKVQDRRADHVAVALFNKKGKAVYVPLARPKAGVVRLADLALATPKEFPYSMEIAAVAKDNLLSLPGAGAALSGALRTFEDHLVDLAKGEDDKEIRMGARLGYVLGTMENGSGVEHPRESERHYLMAMMLLTTTIGNTATPLFEFACDSGYVLARSRDRDLDALVNNATAEVPGFLAVLHQPPRKVAR